MHYANGQEAKLGDLVYKPSDFPGDSEMIGVLAGANASSDACNGTVSPLACRYHSDLGASAWTPAGQNGSWCTTVGKLLPLNPAAMPLDPDAPPDAA